MSSMQMLINTVKGLVIDGVHKAKSGHPGGAMSSADFACILFRDFLRFDPNDPHFFGRDRFVLSAGHESMLLYSLLYMNGWLELKDLQNFRQLHSRTPGHPENTLTPGVECTTGPLGQGAAMSVGMALASKHLSTKFGEDFFGGRCYALLGDGCMQEDVTLGAASLAGHWRLHNLIWFYDRNQCQISGAISRACSDDYEKIFSGFGWNTITIDGHDHDQIRKSLKTALNSKLPTLIIGHTTMAKGAAGMEGDHETHGAPLPAEERTKTKAKLGIPEGQEFYCAKEVWDYYRSALAEKQNYAQSYKQKLAAKKSTDAKFKDQWNLFIEGKKDFSVSSLMPPMNWKNEAAATRNIFGEILKQAAESLPMLVGGSADLEPSNMTGAFAKAVGDFQKESPHGRNLNFGVREFPMSAICNGIALHGGLIPFDATFLSFSDYARPALRLGAIQKVRVIHEYTHDSFYLGEDGPTHQPIEHLAALRSIPDLYVMRPADAYETETMFRCALDLNAPSAICLTRQKLAQLDYASVDRSTISKGAFVLKNDPNPKIIFFATGSEVHLALKVAKQVNLPCIVVSVPCWELFFSQDESYIKSVLKPEINLRVSIEAGSRFGWERFVGNQGIMIGIDRYGDSAPMEALEKEYGFHPDAICHTIMKTFPL